MSEFWSGVLTGISTSGFVAGIVYWVQKRDSARSESSIQRKISGTTAIAREALRTTLVIQGIASDIHEAVRGGQVAAALNPGRETLRPSHQVVAQEFLQHADFDSLKQLHHFVTGESCIYAGLIRDAEVLVSEGREPSLVPVHASEIHACLRAWIAQLNCLIESKDADKNRRISTIAQLHVDLMRIHPFFDGNGLIGRAIVSALCERVLGASCVIARNDPEYFACLRLGLSGRLEPFMEYLEHRLST